MSKPATKYEVEKVDNTQPAGLSDVSVVVAGTTKLGAAWADFVAQEVARAIDNLETFGVTAMGDFGCVNSEEERAARFKQLVKACRERVTICVSVVG